MEILPASERGLLVHLCVHLPEMTGHLGPANGYHMFPFESFFGYLKRFVQSKSHPEANLVMCYRFVVFGRILRARYPDALSAVEMGDLLVLDADVSSDEEDLEEVLPEGVLAPLRVKCRAHRALSSEEKQSLYLLLGHDVR
jgi:hypothetical protein